jgi:glycosyltransferase involved in cell wall biosynthesis
MKLLMVTFGTELVASSRTRAYQWLPHLKEKGVKVSLIPLSLSLEYAWKLDARKQKAHPALKGFFKVAIGLARFLDAIIVPIQKSRVILKAPRVDIVYIQKALLSEWFLKVLFYLNKNLAFDFDDAIQELSEKKAKMTECTLKYCKIVTVENNFNGDFSQKITGREPLYILGPIDCDRYTPRKNTSRDKIVIGWIGSPSTSVYLNECKEPLMALLNDHQNLNILLIGAGANPINHPRCISRNWELATECNDLNQFDIGIMPLPDNPWTRGKGGYKILQYMAIGIPSVASPVGVNSQIIDHGINGFLASQTSEWYLHLNELVSSPQKRLEMGIRAREKAVSNYSFQSYLPQLLSAFEFTTKN